MAGLDDPGRRASRRASRARRGSSGARKRYYIFSQDFRRPFNDFLFLNKDEALKNGRMAGRHEHIVPGYRSPFTTGLPPLLGKPAISIRAETDELLDLYGFKPYFVSSRAKDLLSRLDPEGFEFAECATFDRSDNPAQPYWMTEAVRIVREFDEQRSSFQRYVDANPGTEDPLNPAIVALNDIYMSADLPESYHSFYFPRYAGNFIVDAAIADAWREAGLTGAVFTPLQPPTEDDLGSVKDDPDYFYFKNRPYWNREAVLS